MLRAKARPRTLDPLGLVERARAAQADWASRSPRVRVAFLGRLRRLLADRLAALEAAAGRRDEAGRAETLSAEVLPLLEALRFLEREGPRILAPRRVGRRGRPAWLFGHRAQVRREPLGVVLVLAPANYPVFLPGVQAAQALAAGNAVLLKPAPRGETAARLLADLMAEAGLPEHVVQVLPSSIEAGRAACASGVDKVVLTGSAETGRSVLLDLATGLVPATVELSGCDAVFVLPGADLDRVARALRFGLCLNGGETCIAPRRVFVTRESAGDLEALLRAELDPARPAPLRREMRRRLRRIVDEALAGGARIVSGARPAGDTMQPLVLADVTADAEVARSDVFAPVLSILPVDDVDQALELDARCPYALGASVFGPPAEAEAFARRVTAGGVSVNDLILPTADPRLPFGGRGESGFGVTRGPEGLLDMTFPKVIATRRGGMAKHLDAPTGGEADLFRALVQAGHAGTLGGRMRGWLSVVQAGRALASAQKRARRTDG